VRTTEHPGDILDAAEFEQPSHHRASGGHLQPVDEADPPLLGDDDLVAPGDAEFTERLDRAGPGVAESEVGPLDDASDRAAHPVEQIVDERLGIEGQKFRRGLQFQHAIRPRLAESSGPLAGGQDPGRLGKAEHHGGGGLEGDRHDLARLGRLAGPAPGQIEQRSMTEVDAVEVADGEAEHETFRRAAGTRRA